MKIIIPKTLSWKYGTTLGFQLVDKCPNCEEEVVYNFGEDTIRGPKVDKWESEWAYMQCKKCDHEIGEIEVQFKYSVEVRVK